jgi:predicted DsbA family dithiol-disulfide isomerase
MITVEIWSDVVCPFCYIGKRNFETALSKFGKKDDVRITWKSFELDPTAKYKKGKGIHESLAEKYGNTVEWAREMTAQVSRTAEKVGLKFAIDRTAPTNTLDAHRLIHLAAIHGLQDKAEERLFAAYFTEGKQIGDHTVLTELGKEIGLPEKEIADLFFGDNFTSEVRSDEEQAKEFGINAVPTFIINRKYAVTGAQPAEVFLKTLETASKA